MNVANSFQQENKNALCIQSRSLFQWEHSIPPSIIELTHYDQKVLWRNGGILWISVSLCCWQVWHSSGCNQMILAEWKALLLNPYITSLSAQDYLIHEPIRQEEGWLGKKLAKHSNHFLAHLIIKIFICFYSFLSFGIGHEYLY